LKVESFGYLIIIIDMGEKYNVNLFIEGRKYSVVVDAGTREEQEIRESSYRQVGTEIQKWAEFIRNNNRGGSEDDSQDVLARVLIMRLSFYKRAMIRVDDSLKRIKAIDKQLTSLLAED